MTDPITRLNAVLGGRRRINVTGNAGVGKSTLASLLGDHLGLPVVGLDQVVWRPGWGKTPSPERERLEREIASRPAWIVDGVSRIIREAADTIVFIDFPRRIAISRCAMRNWRYLFRSRPGLPERCPEVLIAPRLLRTIWRFPALVRPQILREFGTWRTTKMLVHIQSQAELNKVLTLPAWTSVPGSARS